MDVFNQTLRDAVKMMVRASNKTNISKLERLNIMRDCADMIVNVICAMQCEEAIRLEMDRGKDEDMEEGII